MDLNHINLPASLIEDLYKNHLIESESAKPSVKRAPANIPAKTGIQYLGKNQRGVCVLVDYPNDVYLPDEQLNFLTSILQACKLHLGDVAIINCNRQQINFTDLKKELFCDYLLVFGVDALQIGLQQTSSFAIHPHDGCNIVYAPAAEHLNNNQPEGKQLKSKLWTCLKQLFAV